jgi:hypothetical protein
MGDKELKKFQDMSRSLAYQKFTGLFAQHVEKIT